MGSQEFIYLFIVYLFVYLFNYHYYLLKELGVEGRRERDLSESLLDESPELLCGGSLWDPRNDYEQLESLCHARRSTCELMFEKVLIYGERNRDEVGLGSKGVWEGSLHLEH